jgi:hypothetical protein
LQKHRRYSHGTGCEKTVKAEKHHLRRQAHAPIDQSTCQARSGCRLAVRVWNRATWIYSQEESPTGVIQIATNFKARSSSGFFHLWSDAAGHTEGTVRGIKQQSWAAKVKA